MSAARKGWSRGYARGYEWGLRYGPVVWGALAALGLVALARRVLR